MKNHSLRFKNKSVQHLSEGRRIARFFVPLAIQAASQAKLALFTTYKFVTGSMFRKMNVHLVDKFSSPEMELKSRDGMLSEEDKHMLDSFIQ